MLTWGLPYPQLYDRFTVIGAFEEVSDHRIRQGNVDRIRRPKDSISTAASWDLMSSDELP